MTEPQREMYLAERVAVDAESTSAALRRVQAELDAERDKRAEDIAAYERACGLAVVAERERDHWIKEHDKVIEVCVRVGQERDSARAELVSARTELDAVRTVRDNLDRELAEARATIRALVAPAITRRTEESETT